MYKMKDPINTCPKGSSSGPIFRTLRESDLQVGSAGPEPGSCGPQAEGHWKSLGFDAGYCSGFYVIAKIMVLYSYDSSFVSYTSSININMYICIYIYIYRYIFF